MKALENYTTDQLRKELEERGYYTRNLWQLEDVQEYYECSDEQAMDVLDKVMTLPYITGEITEHIESECESRDFESK